MTQHDADMYQKVQRLESIVERYAALAQQNPQAASSVEIKQLASGKPQYTIKVYHQDPEYALETAQRLYDEATGGEAAA